MIEVLWTRHWWMVAHDGSCDRELLVPQRGTSFHVLFREIDWLVHVPNEILGSWQSYWGWSDMHGWLLIWWRGIVERPLMSVYQASFPVHLNKLACLIQEELRFTQLIYALINVWTVKIGSWTWRFQIWSLQSCAFKLSSLNISCPESHTTIIKALLVRTFIGIIVPWTTNNSLLFKFII